MEELARWMKNLGLEQYAEAFADNDISFDILPDLTDEDLKELGLSLGHRRKFLKEAAKLIEPAEPAPTPQAQPSEPSSPKAPGELSRRLVTVMFSDLVDSTAMSNQLDAEDCSDVNNAFRDACSACIERFGGRIDRFFGDGMLATFGLHNAHEDDPERAIRAGLDIVNDMGELDATVGKAKGVELAVRLSVATGLVVGGDFTGRGSWEEQDGIVGVAPNLAARLLGIGDPNTLVIDPETKRLVADQFEYLDLGERMLKGFPDPVGVWQVLGEKTILSRLKARGSEFTPLVGREEEVDILLRRWERTKSGHGQVALITGPAGIGKSRVAESIHERVAPELDLAHGYQCYQCSPYHANTALYPVIKLIATLAGFSQGDSDEAKYAKLESLLGGIAGNDGGELAIIADLLELSTITKHPALECSPKEKRERALASLEAWFKTLASSHPLLLIFEDLQWMDPTLQSLLRRLVNLAKATRVLIIMTMRAEQTDRRELSKLQDLAPSRWLNEPHVTQCELRKLGGRDIEQLVEATAKGRALPPDIAAVVLEKAEGIPLYAEELTKGLLSSQTLAGGNGAHVSTGSSASVAIPSSIHGALMARFDQLGEAKKVAQLGAAIGREFSHDLLSEISALSEDELSDSLRELTKSEIVFQRDDSADSMYVFKHALLQDAAYESLPRSRRKKIHLSIAESLERHQQSGSGAELELLARHYSQGEAVNKAISYWTRAAEHAFAHSAQVEAAHHLEEALGSINKLEEDPERPKLELDLVVKRAAALRAVHGYAWDELEKLYVRAGSLFEQIGETSDRFGVEWARLLFFLVRGDLDRASEVPKALLDYAERHQDRHYFMDAHLGEGMVKFHLGDFESARASLQQSAALSRPGKDRPHVLTHGHDPSIFSNSYLAWSLWFLGYPDQARDLIAKAVRDGRETSQPYSQAAALTFAIRIAQFRGDIAAAKQMAHELVTISRQGSYAYYVAQGTMHEGWALVAEGEAEAGVGKMQRGMAMLKETGTVLGLRGCLVQLAEGYEQLGLREKALEALDEAYRGDNGTGTRFWDAEIERLRGELLAAGDKKEQKKAEAAFRKGLQIACDQKALALELRVAVSYTRWLKQKSRYKEAFDLLDACVQRLHEGEQTVDFRNALKLLQECQNKMKSH